MQQKDCVHPRVVEVIGMLCLSDLVRIGRVFMSVALGIDDASCPMNLNDSIIFKINRS